ncbi:MAG TPA: hypothetical protein VGI88_06000 [Verrucomicrobiae bacterium]
MNRTISMKLLIAILMPIAVSAQIVTTNWVMTAQNVREVNGKFYNVDHSVLFTNFYGECENVFDNGILINDNRNGGYKPIFVLNFPKESQPTTGSRQWGRAMKIGTTNIGNETAELLDFGKRHLIPIVKTNGISK